MPNTYIYCYVNVKVVLVLVSMLAFILKNTQHTFFLTQIIAFFILNEGCRANEHILVVGFAKNNFVEQFLS